MAKIFVTVHDYSADAVKLLVSRGFDVTVNPENLEYDLRSLMNEYDGLIVGVKDRIRYPDIPNDCKCKFIGTLSVGMDHVQELLQNSSIKIANIAGYNSQSVAEFIQTTQNNSKYIIYPKLFES